MTTSQTTVRMQANPKRIRGVRSGRTIVDSTDVQFVWEHRYYPAWYVPAEHILGDLRANGETLSSEGRGDGTRYDLVLEDGAIVPNAAWRHVDSPVEALRSLVRIEWDAMHAWFEEDVEVFVHPRSPEVRIDALPSSRHLRVLIDGEVVADSHRPTLLFETGLPTRFYLPKADVRMDLLTPSDSSTACPYKGWANYWSVKVGETVHDDLVWGYRTPLPESQNIAGLVCFYSERVSIEVDGVPLA